MIKILQFGEGNFLRAFSNSVIERFNNPFIDHKLLDISLNSVAKFKARCLCSLLDYYNKFGKIPSVLSFSFAALINFYEDFENKDYPVNDVESVLYFFKAKHNDIVFDVLANIGFCGEDLTKIDGLYKKVKHLNDIPFGHKVLLNDLKNGENIIKYGNPIGHLTIDCKKGEHCKKQGLNLLTGPGNDIVSTTNLTAAGANIILFTTGRGTPLGASVPTIKVASNSRLAKRKSNWIDFNAGELIKSNDFENMTEEIFKLLIDIASGRQTKNEQNGYRDISIFKDGVIM